MTQLPILVALGWKGPLPITLLADVLGLDRTTLTRNLKVLEQRGLLVVVEDADDARVRLAQITDAGVEVLSNALVLWRGVHEAVALEFGEPRLRSLLGELSTLSAAVEG